MKLVNKKYINVIQIINDMLCKLGILCALITQPNPANSPLDPKVVESRSIQSMDTAENHS